MQISGVVTTSQWKHHQSRAEPDKRFDHRIPPAPAQRHNENEVQVSQTIGWWLSPLLVVAIDLQDNEGHHLDAAGTLSPDEEKLV